MGIVIIRDFSKLKCINWRQSDNLPDHVKGTATFETHQRLRGKANKDTGYYVNSTQGKVAVEFVTIDGEDHWITLTTDKTAEVWYSKSNRIVPKDNTALGFWSTDNSQHPDFFLYHPEHTKHQPRRDTCRRSSPHCYTPGSNTIHSTRTHPTPD